MIVKKYEHSCLDIQSDTSRIIIDPGKFSIGLKDYENIDALVITHIHSDHFDETHVHAIKEHNPNVLILTNPEVAPKIANAQIAELSKTYTIGDITLEFFGTDHELYDGVKNIGVMVNDKLYYPGDSYTVPSKPVTVLAAPASAPWLRVPDAQKFLQACKPQRAFPMHNAILSEAGESIHYRLLGEAAAEVGCSWEIIKPGQSIEI